MNELTEFELNTLRKIIQDLIGNTKKTIVDLNKSSQNKIFLSQSEITISKLVKCLDYVISKNYQISEKKAIIEGYLCFLKDQKIILVLSLKNSLEDNSPYTLTNIVNKIDQEFSFSEIASNLGRIYSIIASEDNSWEIVRKWTNLELRFQKEVLIEWQNPSDYYSSFFNYQN